MLLYTFIFAVIWGFVGNLVPLRRMYVKLLLKIFEFGSSVVHEKANKSKTSVVDHSEDVKTPSQTQDGKDYTKNVSNNGVQQQQQLQPNDDTTDQNEYLNDTNKTNNISTNYKDTFVNDCNTNGNIDPGNCAEKVKMNGDVNNHQNTVITREAKLNAPDLPHSEQNMNGMTGPNELEGDKATDDDDLTNELDFQLESCFDYIKSGVESIIEDEVTSRFEAEELKNWNLLTRTNRRYEFISWKLTVMWVNGFFIRYFILLPLRVTICFIGVWYLTVSTAVVGCLPDGETKRKMVRKVLILCFEFLSTALSTIINYHNLENRPTHGICVANHTSPIDVLMLMCDNCYSLIGQSHGGFLGLLQRALARASPHIWFERAEAKDRLAVARRLREHVSETTNPPILIFPEGTCINNTSVMQFKKGCFEVDSVIFPVAIKYDPKFGDAFWNSSRYSMMQYLYMMMTSWAIVCDVWYLPPMYKEENETAIDFANRVKGVIAKQGGLVDLMWDGQLKRMKPKKNGLRSSKRSSRND